MSKSIISTTHIVYLPMYSKTLIAAFLPFVATVAAIFQSSALPWSTVAQLQNGTWLENIAVRSNGDILVTSLNDNPGIYILRRQSTPSFQKAELELLVPAADFDGANLALGLAEIETDENGGTETWAVAVGRASGFAQFDVGSFSVWTVKFDSTTSEGKVKVNKVTHGTATSVLLNGITAIPGVPNVALVADSGGLIARVDLLAGTFDDESFAFSDAMTPRSDSGLPVGANGVHVRDGHLYWTKSDQTTIYRLPITKDGYPERGAEPEAMIKLSDLTHFVDDFIFDSQGNVYVAAFDSNSLIRVSADFGKAEVVVGSADALILPGVTAAAFGRGEGDQHTLYVVTSGGLAGAVNGKTEGAKVVAVDTVGNFGSAKLGLL